MEVEEENKDLRQEVSDLYDFGAYKNLERKMENESWAEDNRKLWEAQKKNIAHIRTIVEDKEKLKEAHIAIRKKDEQINSLEEGVCSLLEFSQNLIQDESRAEEVYNAAEKILKECNIFLHNEDVEMVDDK
jgi:hypothetical protein